MCKAKRYKRIPNTRIDDCMVKGIKSLSLIFKHVGFKILACCCGHHGRYPMTIVYKLPMGVGIWELFSGKVIPRTRNFYKRDKQGYYYVPEVCEEKR